MTANRTGGRAAAFIGVPYQAVYAATKWFVLGLSESVRQELRDQGHRHIHVTVVTPVFADGRLLAIAASRARRSVAPRK